MIEEREELLKKVKIEQYTIATSAGCIVVVEEQGKQIEMKICLFECFDKNIFRDLIKKKSESMTENELIKILNVSLGRISYDDSSICTIVDKLLVIQNKDYTISINKDLQDKIIQYKIFHKETSKEFDIGLNSMLNVDKLVKNLQLKNSEEDWFNNLEFDVGRCISFFYTYDHENTKRMYTESHLTCLYGDAMCIVSESDNIVSVKVQNNQSAQVIEYLHCYNSYRTLKIHDFLSKNINNKEHLCLCVEESFATWEDVDCVKDLCKIEDNMLIIKRNFDRMNLYFVFLIDRGLSYVGICDNNTKINKEYVVRNFSEVDGKFNFSIFMDSSINNNVKDLNEIKLQVQKIIKDCVDVKLYMKIKLIKYVICFIIVLFIIYVVLILIPDYDI